ncbi:basal cell adhesion molecule isoform X2 [Peromyscus californicus insignis]|uniref:basal cell adhesion molecule isoform X2 n=1 Tax=Peromyscus californicus insignis TaxID=564181 RepID=UPI0022A7436E|nr:basal cell adhesion molecule isoform X2 [Peromyscus californicus insignis]
MEPPDARAAGLLWLALLLAGHSGAQAEVHVSVPPLVEVLQGELITLDCTPREHPEHYVLEWFLVDASGSRHHLASVEPQGSELLRTVHSSRGRSPPYKLDSKGRLEIANAQVGDEWDYVCVVKAGPAGTSEATSSVRVFKTPEATDVIPNKGTLSVMEEFAQEIATCSSPNGNPVPRITWYRNGQRLDVPMEMNPKGYMTSRTVREASGLYSLTSTLYLRVYKEDRDANFHCASHYKLPSGQHGRLDSPNFQLTLHYPTEHVEFWVGSPSTTEGWVREGDAVQLLCQGDGSPSPEYSFFRLQGTQEEQLNVNLRGNLTLEKVHRDQSGVYGCRVEDYDAGEEVQLVKILELHVAYLDPLELSVPEELYVFLNSSRTVVNCSARGLPAPTVRWTKDSVTLADGPVLSLNSVTFDSAGTYTCEASTPTVPLLSRTQSFQLVVQGAPELKPNEIKPVSGSSWMEGDEVMLVCSARGYPEPKLTWSQRGDTPAEPPFEGKGWTSSSLMVKVTSALSQEGVSCDASNIHGEIGHVFHFGSVAPQTAQAGVAVMAVAVSVGLLLLVVAAFYCMRRKGRPGCCRRSEKAAPPSREPEMSHSGSDRPEQTGLLMGGPSGGGRVGSGGFGDEC